MKLKLYKIYIHKNVFKSYEIYNRSFNINFNKFLSILIVWQIFIQQLYEIFHLSRIMGNMINRR